MTLRNAGIAAVVFMVVFAAISIRSEMQTDDPRSFGRIVDRALPEVKQKKSFEVVSESEPPIADQTAPDPMLLEPLAREQWLRDQQQPLHVAAAAVEPATYEPLPIASNRRPVQEGEGEIVIVGGPEGLRAEVRPARRPPLARGFGRTD